MTPFFVNRLDSSYRGGTPIPPPTSNAVSPGLTTEGSYPFPSGPNTSTDSPPAFGRGALCPLPLRGK